MIFARLVFLLACLLAPTMALAGPAVVVAFQVAAVGASLAGVAAWIPFAIAAAGAVVAVLTAPTPELPRRTGGYTTNIYDSAAPVQYVYGTARIGGVIVYDEATDETNKPGGVDIDNPELHRVVVLTGHECESIERYYAEDTELVRNADGHVTNYPPEGLHIVTESGVAYPSLIVRGHRGTDDQDADSLLVQSSGNLWTSGHRMRGCAYLYARYLEDENYDRWPQGPVELTAEVKGKKIRTITSASVLSSTYTFSNNAAEVILDYLLTHPELRVDLEDVDLASFYEAKTDCDTRRYTIDGSYQSNTRPEDILGFMAQACGGVLWFGRGKWRLRAGVWKPASVTFDQDDVIGPLAVIGGAPTRDNYNAVQGRFSGPETSYSDSDYPKVSVASYVAADGGENTLSLDLPFTSTAEKCQQLAKISLEKSRQRIKVTGLFSMKAYEVSAGDTVRLTLARYGWDRKNFEVVGWKLALSGESIGVELALIETSSSIYNTYLGEDYSTDNTELGSPYRVADVGISLSSELSNDFQTVEGVINILVTGSYVDQVEVQAKRSSDTVWKNVGRGGLGTYVFRGVEDDDYDVRARGINALGVRGAWRTVSDYSVSVFSTPPTDITGLMADSLGESLLLSWHPVDDLDLSHYVIRYITDPAGKLRNSLPLVEKVARPATSIVVPYVIGRYFVAAVDKLGNISRNYASVKVDDDPFDRDWREVETFRFHEASGSKAIWSYAGSRLPMGLSVNGDGALVATASDVREYRSDRTLTFSESYDVRLVVKELDVARRVPSALFEEAPGLFDAFFGLFDDALQNADDGLILDWTATPVVKIDDTQDGDEAYTPLAGAIRRVTSTTSPWMGLDLHIETAGVTLWARKFTVGLRLRRRSEEGSGTANGAIVFSDKFYAAPTLHITPHNLGTGEYYTITAATRTGFTITFYDSTATAVARNFDWLAVGAGKEV